MAAAATEALSTILSLYPQTCRKPTFFLHTVSFRSPVCRSVLLSTTQQKNPPLRSTLENVLAVGETQDKTISVNERRRKLFVQNLPWSFSVSDIKGLFGECGTVSDVEIIKQKNGKSEGFAFVTMSSGEEAQAAIDKFHSHELSERIIRVEFAKRFKKPPRAPPTGPPSGETRHKLYVSNLAWKVRSNNLRDFFSAEFRPVSARVVFDSPSGKSAGYGFVSFASKEEAESAISVLNGKELMGRPVRLKFSEREADASESKLDQIDEV